MNKPQIVLVSCTSKKIEGKTKAVSLYNSTLFRYSIGYAKSLNPLDIYILSTKYGLVELEQEIESYDVSLKSYTKEARRVWSEQVLVKLKDKIKTKYNKNLEEVQFVILAGKMYTEFLLPHLDYIDPLKKMSIGKRIQWLKQNI